MSTSTIYYASDGETIDQIVENTTTVEQEASVNSVVQFPDGSTVALYDIRTYWLLSRHDRQTLEA